ncbi:MAG: tRNA (adenosine(37)-N6)-threonylcarbamoyltransferase complex ATPase subunit type 1 TsaE [Phycisphaerales bacterium]|nr:tRNA (adenosine(37)-N6)-threonylcarbamoyltransferase complex ATPase subunit type 1 TsaE [Phycisphaerales bacterium]
MREVRIESRSLEDTARFAAALGGIVRAGDTIALRGEMGAGKTTLVRMLCAAMGVDEGLVSSPTFVIAQEYPVPTGDVAKRGDARSIERIVHIDAYRLRSAEELEDAATGAFAPDALTLVEWPERCADAMPAGAIELAIEHAGGSNGAESRRIVLSLPEGAAKRAGIERLAAGSTGGRVDTTCPITGRSVPADSPTWPFSDDRARMADLERWFSGRYTVSRPAEGSDVEEGD